jgi:hypothetical protein
MIPTERNGRCWTWGADMLSGSIHGRLSRYPMFHQVCSLTVQNKTGTGILKLGESVSDGLRHTEGSSWYLKKEKRRRC